MPPVTWQGASRQTEKLGKSFEFIVHALVDCKTPKSQAYRTIKYQNGPHRINCTMGVQLKIEREKKGPHARLASQYL